MRWANVCRPAAAAPRTGAQGARAHQLRAVPGAAPELRTSRAPPSKNGRAAAGPARISSALRSVRDIGTRLPGAGGTRCHNAGMNSIDSASPGDYPSEIEEADRRKPGRPRAGGEDKRERILNEAIALFGAHGYAGTSLADIATASDISKAGLLHHFSSKEALFARVLARRDQDDFVGVMGGGAIEDPWELLDAFVALVAHNSAHRDLVAIYAATAVSVLDAEHPAHRWFASHLAGSVRMIEEALERGKETGTVRPEAPSRMIARSVVALSDGLQIQWLCSTTPDSAADQCLATSMEPEVRMFVDGLRERWRIDADARG